MIASGLLVGLGFYLMFARDNEEESVEALAAARGWAAIGLGLSVSLDEFAIGFSFGALRVPVLPALVLIAVQAVVISQLGFRVGHRLNIASRERAERVVGMLLIVIGLTVAAQRLG